MCLQRGLERKGPSYPPATKWAHGLATGPSFVTLLALCSWLFDKELPVSRGCETKGFRGGEDVGPSSGLCPGEKPENVMNGGPARLGFRGQTGLERLFYSSGRKECELENRNVNTGENNGFAAFSSYNGFKEPSGGNFSGAPSTWFSLLFRRTPDLRLVKAAQIY